MKNLDDMTKKQMINELLGKYEYPINRSRSIIFIREVLSKMRQRAQKRKALALKSSYPWGESYILNRNSH